jgi:subtilisin family serine protease
MDRKICMLARTGLLVMAILLRASAQDHYLLRAPSSEIGKIAARHNLSIIRSFEGSASNLHLVAAPAGADIQRTIQGLQADGSVQGVEPDVPVSLPETPAGAPLRQMGLPDPAPVSNRTLVKYYGTLAWDAYVNQAAAFVIKITQAHVFATGSGAVVAVLDTGVDFSQPVLANSLVAGYDFTRNTAGGSEMVDVDQSTDSILDQSTDSILDQSTDSILDQMAALVLNQSTTAILDQSTDSILDRNRSKLPSAFGHGTMVAGLIHLVAPAAKIMPVKVFTGAGTSSLSNIVSGIHWAVDHGADVISMSFSATQSSQTLQSAMDYANSKGVVCVASAGNDGKQTMVYPAGYNSVMGVASTNNQDIRSTFSNYGNALVTVAAPGEAVVTLYPGSHYAEGWGTSFSTPLVAGGLALLNQLGGRNFNEAQAVQAISQAIPTGQGLGAGELDLFQACLYQLFHGGWR